jgi:hypothetical protein
MSRLRKIVAAVFAVVVLSLVLAACGGDDDDEGTTTSAPSSGLAPPSGSAAPPSASGLQLPPGIAECLADQGYEIEPSELHSVPQQVLGRCFRALHQGGL